MKKINIGIIFLLAATFVLVGWKHFDEKKLEVGVSKNTSDLEKDHSTFAIENPPIEFDLPEGYGIHTAGRYEGGYEFVVRIGKKLQDDHLSEAGPVIYIRDFAPQYENTREYKPSEYVDAIFANANPEINKPKIITLFGNKAVETISDADSNPIIVGYLRGDQLPPTFNVKEYSVIIDGTTYGSGKEFSQELFDKVVGSLRIKSQ